jgi:hypothetical protein
MEGVQIELGTLVGIIETTSMFLDKLGSGGLSLARCDSDESDGAIVK